MGRMGRTGCFPAVSDARCSPGVRASAAPGWHAATHGERTCHLRRGGFRPVRCRTAAVDGGPCPGAPAGGGRCAPGRRPDALRTLRRPVARWRPVVSGPCLTGPRPRAGRRPGPCPDRAARPPRAGRPHAVPAGTRSPSGQAVSAHRAGAAASGGCGARAGRWRPGPWPRRGLRHISGRPRTVTEWTVPASVAGRKPGGTRPPGHPRRIPGPSAGYRLRSVFEAVVCRSGRQTGRLSGYRSSGVVGFFRLTRGRDVPSHSAASP